MEDLDDKIVDGGATADGRLANTDWNQVARELQTLIIQTGQTLNSADSAQLSRSIMLIVRGKGFWGTDVGVANVYVIDDILADNRIIALFSGSMTKFRPANNNTGASTINVFGTGVKNIISEGGGAIASGDISTVRDVELRYDGTSWRILDRSLGLVLPGLYPKGHIHGFKLANGVDSEHDIIILTGETSDQNSRFNLDAAGNTKQIDLPWAIGAAGGFPTAITIAVDTWYAVFVIGGTSAVTDHGFDLSISATNLLNAATAATGNTYDKFRQIGWILTDGSANIIQFKINKSDLSEILWETPIVDVSGTAPNELRQLQVVTAPPNTPARIMATISDQWGTSNFFNLDIREVAMIDIAASIGVSVVRGGEASGGSGGESINSVIVLVNTSSTSQIAYRFQSDGDVTNISFVIKTLGFRYNRGRE